MTVAVFSVASPQQVPVQRITKYPLLLGRLLRATAQHDVEMREALREAQAKVESYLTAINAVIWLLSLSTTRKFISMRH